jgi:hypothetical protein
MRALVDSRFKRHFALAETHPRKMSDKKHYVNYRDLHVDFTNYPLYPGGSIPIPRTHKSRLGLNRGVGINRPRGGRMSIDPRRVWRSAAFATSQTTT